jgi:enoyl-CoA hydratase/carnithine racemase
MRECFYQIRDDLDARAVVISGGDAKGFTAGLDLSDSFDVLQFQGNLMSP